MAAAQQPNSSGEAQVQSSFPLPPVQFSNNYTNEAVLRGIAPKPPSPINGSYMMFGLPCHQDDLIIRPLELQGLRRLHPQVYDRRKELKKLNVSILCNFLDLLDILVNATGSQARDEKIEDLNLLFIHIHHLINEFRPHQARETLKVMMEMQQTQMLDVAERLWKHIEKAGKVLSNGSVQLLAMQKRESMVSESMMDTATVALDVGMKDTQDDNMEVDEANLVKNILDKDSILAGLIDDIQE